MDRPIAYRIRIRGQLGPEWSSWFSALTVEVEPEGTSLLSGCVADQAALHGLLAAVRDLGLPLVSLETFAGPDPLIDPHTPHPLPEEN